MRFRHYDFLLKLDLAKSHEYESRAGRSTRFEHLAAKSAIAQASLFADPLTAVFAGLGAFDFGTAVVGVCWPTSGLIHNIARLKSPIAILQIIHRRVEAQSVLTGRSRPHLLSIESFRLVLRRLNGGAPDIFFREGQ